MYDRILLAYDGSLEGAIALREGALLARRCGAEVFLLSVVPQTAGVHMAEGAFPGVVAQQIESYTALLERGVERLKQLGLKPDARLVIGEPAETIGAFAHEIGADLVVVGHHKQGFLERWWSGSSGAYLSDCIHCSLLVGRNAISDEQFEAELREAGLAQS